jgi:hypothetical protein
MFSTLRTRFGIPGVISVIALVFAMFGGAYAASNSSGGGKATASAKAKQGPRGKTGKTGPTGPAGAKGDPGAPGAQGNPGAPGAPGAAGKSVTGEPIVAGGSCGENAEGVKYTLNAVSTNVCSGEDGTTGFTAILPEGAEETGTWVMESEGGEGENALSPISFPIPLSVADAEAIEVHRWIQGNPAEQDSQCLGNVKHPEAEAGSICLYSSVAKEQIEIPPLFPPGSSTENKVGTSGAFLRWEEFSGPLHVSGSFAITAP